MIRRIGCADGGPRRHGFHPGLVRPVGLRTYQLLGQAIPPPCPPPGSRGEGKTGAAAGWPSAQFVMPTRGQIEKISPHAVRGLTRKFKLRGVASRSVLTIATTRLSGEAPSLLTRLTSLAGASGY
jgi:hypothetical protein